MPKAAVSDRHRRDNYPELLDFRPQFWLLCPTALLPYPPVLGWQRWAVECALVWESTQQALHLLNKGMNK